MALHFKILDSTDPLVIGNLTRLKPGLLIGRAKGNLIIEDERISSIHAEVQTNNQGEYFLVDKDSRNGIKVEGKRITKLLITPGIMFQIGNTLFEVVYKESAPIPEGPTPKEINQNNITTETKDLLSSINVSSFNAQKPIFFNSAVKLTVIQGLQLDQKWRIEYGPYKFGSGCIGGLLIGDKMPKEVFEITYGSSGTVLRTKTDQRILKLNSIPLVGESLVENNDILSIHISESDITRIKIEF